MTPKGSASLAPFDFSLYSYPLDVYTKSGTVPFTAEKAASIYTYASSQVDTLPMDDATIQHKMLTLASQLPEYPVVIRMFGVGPVLCPQLMAEIGDVRRFKNKQSDDPVFQFLDRKRQEGKHYYVYMTAAANKFLRIYYGTVMAYLANL